MKPKIDENITDLTPFLLEFARFAELEREDLDLSDEFDASIYSTWYLLNPFEVKKRRSVGTNLSCSKCLSKKLTKKLSFTAHSHHNKPLEASPDDISLYEKIVRKPNKFVHFIVDRFNCRKIR